jgi:hypothetical protein
MLRPADFFLGLLTLTPVVSLVHATGKIEWERTLFDEEPDRTYDLGHARSPAGLHRPNVPQDPNSPARQNTCPSRNHGSQFCSTSVAQEKAPWVYMAALGAKVQAYIGQDNSLQGIYTDSV